MSEVSVGVGVSVGAVVVGVGVGGTCDEEVEIDRV